MSFPYTGFQKRERIKIRDLIRGRLEKLEMERVKYEDNIIAFRWKGKSDTPKNFHIIEFNFKDKYITEDELIALLIDRMGDVFNV